MKLIVLDRDGVINQESEEYIRRPDEWRPLPGSIEAITRLRYAEYRVVVASNQAGLRRRMFTIEDLVEVNSRMHRVLLEHGALVDAVFFCPCLPRDGCACRKPRPGMLEDIAERLRTSMKGVPFVGDKLSDIECARAAGASPHLVRTGYGRNAIEEATGQLDGVPVHDDLAAAVEALLGAPGAAA